MDRWPPSFRKRRFLLVTCTRGDIRLGGWYFGAPAVRLGLMASATLVGAICVLASAATATVLSIAAAFTDGGGVASSVQELVITPHIQEEEYCRDQGIDQLRLTLGFTFSNRGDRPLIVPVLTRLSEVRVEADPMKPIRLRYKLSAPQGISGAIYATATPSPTLFYVLSPGQSREGMSQFTVFGIAPRGTRAKRGVLSPGEYKIVVDLNLGARLPSDIPVSKDHWSDVGTLVLGMTPAVPMQLKLADPRHAVCVTPRLIL